MRRRDFITLLGIVAAGSPFAARAQQPTKQHRIGVITLGDAVAKSFEAELREGLRQSGLIEGQNLQYESRAADGNIALLPKIAAELVALNIDVMVALYTPCALAAQRATRDIPIVVVAGDPVGLGLVASLARPGGNITGISLIAAELHGKCVELFRDLIPGIRRVAVLGNAPDPIVKPMLEQVRLAGKNAGIEIGPEILVGASDEIDLAFAAMKKDGAGAVVAQASLAPSRVVECAFKHRLPTAAVSNHLLMLAL